MAEFLLIDGEIAARESVHPRVRWRTEAGNPPGWNLPLAGALLLHLLFLVLALLATRLDQGRQRSSEVYPIRLYTPAEVTGSAGLEQSAPVPSPLRRLPVAHPAAAEARPPASSSVSQHSEMVPAAVAPLAPAIAPVAVSAAVAPAAGQVTASPSTEVTALPAVPEQGLAARGVAVSPGATTSAASGRLAEAVSAVPAALPVVLAQPLYRENPAPEYPPLAKRRQLEGTVVLEVLVDVHGLAGDLSVHQSSGHRLLDEAALKSVKNWRFEPGRRGVVPLAMPVLVPVRFALR